MVLCYKMSHYFKNWTYTLVKRKQFISNIESGILLSDQSLGYDIWPIYYLGIHKTSLEKHICEISSPIKKLFMIKD